MRSYASLAAGVLLISLGSVSAQQPPPPPTTTLPPAGGRPSGPEREAFPHQQRALAEPAVIERGATVYGIYCRLCHGPDLRGGDMGGVNLIRSQLVLNDQDGELIAPVLAQGRSNPGAPPMPPIPIPAADAKAVAAFIHSVVAKSARQGGPPPGEAPPVLNILVGDPAAGATYFGANCAACHSATGDMQGVAARYPDPMQLQNSWVTGRRAFQFGPRPPGPPAAEAAPTRPPQPVTVTVTTRLGKTISGRLDRIDDFIVSLVDADGARQTFRRSGAFPKVEIKDPLEGHKKLLVKYTDKDIHDVTAYLVTLK